MFSSSTSSFNHQISIHFLKKKQLKDREENLKAAFDASQDIIGMNNVLKKICSFERFVWTSNQVDLLKEANVT